MITIIKCGDCGEEFEHFHQKKRQGGIQKKFCDRCVNKRKYKHQREKRRERD